MSSKQSLFSSPEMNNNKWPIKLNYCKVCGDNARIINYGALSCQSCKTFFRRNGFRPETVRPCQCDGECEVNISTRRVCTACRLGKCFKVGMSADLIRKEDYHHKKHFLSTESVRSQASEHKRRVLASQLAVLDLLQNDRSSLTPSEWTLFSNVLHAFDTFSVIPTLHHILKIISSSSLSGEVCFDTTGAFETIASMYTSMQSFVRSIPDFQVLCINEQQSLFQRNLHGISSFYSNLAFRDIGLLKNTQCFQSYVAIYGLEIMEQSNRLVNRLHLESILFKLLLIIIAFSSNCFIVNVHSNMSNDSLIYGTFRLYGSQNVYVELLWKYMLYRYGFYDTVLYFNNLVKHILDMIKHSTTIYTSHEVHYHFVDDVVEKAKEKLIISQNDLIPVWGKTLSSS